MVLNLDLSRSPVASTKSPNELMQRNKVPDKEGLLVGRAYDLP